MKKLWANTNGIIKLIFILLIIIIVAIVGQITGVKSLAILFYTIAVIIFIIIILFFFTDVKSNKITPYEKKKYLNDKPKNVKKSKDKIDNNKKEEKEK